MDRIAGGAGPVPRSAGAAQQLRKRTLTNLHNAHPQWLADTHEVLDAAVATAYGWDAGIGEEEALGALLEMNRKAILRREP